MITCLPNTSAETKSFRIHTYSVFSAQSRFRISWKQQLKWRRKTCKTNLRGLTTELSHLGNQTVVNFSDRFTTRRQLVFPVLDPGKTRRENPGNSATFFRTASPFAHYFSKIWPRSSALPEDIRAFRNYVGRVSENFRSPENLDAFHHFKARRIALEISRGIFFNAFVIIVIIL